MGDFPADSYPCQSLAVGWPLVEGKKNHPVISLLVALQWFHYKDRTQENFSTSSSGLLHCPASGIQAGYPPIKLLLILQDLTRSHLGDIFPRREASFRINNVTSPYFLVSHYRVDQDLLSIPTDWLNVWFPARLRSFLGGTASFNSPWNSYSPDPRLSPRSCSGKGLWIERNNTHVDFLEVIVQDFLPSLEASSRMLLSILLFPPQNPTPNEILQWISRYSLWFYHWRPPTP